MSFEATYKRGRERLFSDKNICDENKKLFKKFFEYEEYKLKRTNGIVKIDERSYKTLSDYVFRFKNVNRWFKNKPWKKLTKKDIKKFYDDFEDGKFKGNHKKVVTDRKSYYNKILRSKPFALAGKTEIVKEVMEFTSLQEKDEVRFIEEETFRKIVDVAITPSHKAMLWLCFDIGENISSVLELKKKDCVRGIDPETKVAEYMINLRSEIIKRSRTARTEITNYKETVQFLDLILGGRDGEDLLFSFGHRQASKILDRAVSITGAKCIPEGQKVTLKDLRSSMACDLIDKDWTTDEINARLGHKPSSRVIDKYVNYKAIGKKKPKRKMYENQIAKISIELEEARGRESLHQRRIKKMMEDIDELKNGMMEIGKKNVKIRASLGIVK